MLGVIYGISAMVFYGLANGISKVPLRKIDGIRLVFYRSIIVSVLLGIIALIERPILSWKYIILTMGLSFLGYLGLMFFYKSVSLGKVGVSSSIVSSSFSLTVILSIIFYHEAFGLLRIIATIMILFGMISLTFDKGNKSIFYAVLTFFLWGTSFFLFKIPIMKLGSILSAFIIELSNLIYSSIHLAIKKRLTFNIEKKYFKYIALIGIFGGLGTLFSNLSVSLIGAAAASTLSNSSLAVAVIYGRIFYNEKLSIKKYISILIILAGIILFGLP